MSKQRIIAVAQRVKSPAPLSTDWDSPAGPMLFKAFEEMPKRTEPDDFGDRFWLIDGQRLKDRTFGEETHAFLDGSTCLAIRMQIGRHGKGEEEYEALLKAGWTTEEPSKENGSLPSDRKTA